MDGNRDEAERCTEYAEKYMRDNKWSEAEKFLRKAQKLYPMKSTEGNEHQLKDIFIEK